MFFEGALVGTPWIVGVILVLIVTFLQSAKSPSFLYLIIFGFAVYIFRNNLPLLFIIGIFLLIFYIGTKKG